MAPDGPDQIQHVSDTALMVASCRAIETARADGLVRDPFAERLAGSRGDAILRGITGWQLMCFGIGVRTRFLDDLVIETTITALHRSAFELQHIVRNGDVVAVECSETRVWTVFDAEQERIRAATIPPRVIAAFSG